MNKYMLKVYKKTISNFNNKILKNKNNFFKIIKTEQNIYIYSLITKIIILKTQHYYFNFIPNYNR